MQGMRVQSAGRSHAHVRRERVRGGEEERQRRARREVSLFQENPGCVETVRRLVNGRLRCGPLIGRGVVNYRRPPMRRRVNRVCQRGPWSTEYGSYRRLGSTCGPGGPWGAWRYFYVLLHYSVYVQVYIYLTLEYDLTFSHTSHVPCTPDSSPARQASASMIHRHFQQVPG